MLLLAAKFGIPVCPHAGGVGLCEYVQHLAFFDYIARQRLARGPRRRVGRPPARALPRPGGRRATAATCARRAPGYSIEMLPVVARRVRVPGRPGVGAGRGRGGRRMTVCAEHRSEQRRAVDGGRSPRPLPPAAGGALLAARRPGADPAAADRRRQPDDADLLHEPQHRQRLLADLGDRGPRARPAARDRDARHRPVGRLDDRALGRRRRDRLRARALERARRRSRSSAPALAVGARERPRLRLRPRAASVHRHARDAQHRARHRALGGERHAHPGHAADRRRRSAAARSTGCPYSIFVVAGLALLALVLTTWLVWGRWLYAVGGNPEAARRVGHPDAPRARHRLRRSAASRPASAGCSPRA